MIPIQTGFKPFIGITANLTILMGILDDHHPHPGVADVKAFARELSEKAMSQCRDFMEKRSNEVKEMGSYDTLGFSRS